MATLISVPAGRSFRRTGTKWVDPQPEKGLIELAYQDDLMHLWWKDRTSGAVDDDLIIFPGEATFEKVQQDVTGRTHILKFTSSDQKYFFWFQQRSTEGDLRAEVDINALLQDPSYRPGSAPLPDRPAAPAAAAASGDSAEQSWPPTPGAPLLSHREPAPAAESSAMVGQSGSGPRDTNADEFISRMLGQYLRQGEAGQGAAAVSEDAHLTDILSPSNVTELVRSQPGLAEKLKPLLPPSLGLAEGSTADDLIPILTAPQFTDAVASLDNALRSGGLPGSMMRELGLPEDAGSSVGQFLEALKNLQPKEEDDRMDQD